MAASQSRTVHSKTHRVCPINTRNIGPIGPLSSTIPSPWIESLPKGRTHMPCMIQRATLPNKWLRPNHEWYIRRPTGSVLSTQEIFDSSVHYPVVYHHLESSPYAKAGLICYAWFKELLYQENGCVPIRYGTFQDPQGLSYPHKKYWTQWSHIQYYTITLNRVLSQRQVSYAMHISKSYCARKMAASQWRTVHSKTHRVCPIHTTNIGPIGPLSSTIPSPWIESLPKGRTHMPCMIQRATLSGKWLRPNHVKYIARPTGSVLSTQEILDPSVQYSVLNSTQLNSTQYYNITLNRVLSQRQVSYAMHDSKSYFPTKMAVSQTRTVHSKTRRVCPIHTRNIGPIGPLSSTIPSPWIESLPKGRSDMPCFCTGKMAVSQSHTVRSNIHRVCPIHTRNIGPIGPIFSTIPSHWIESLPKGRSYMPCMIQRATVPGKWLCPKHIRYIPRPTRSVLSTQEILDPSVHYPVLYHHLESSPYPKAGLICRAWFKSLLYRDNGCVPIMYSTFQDPLRLSYPHKKHWTHRSIIQFCTITLNRVLTQRQVWYAMHDSKSYCTRKMDACVPITYGTFQDPQGLSYPHKKYWTHRSNI